MKIVFPYSDCIASLESVQFVQGEVVKHGDPVIVPEYPWEGVLTYLYGSIVKTTIYRMWYQAGGIYVAYGRSRDGIQWEKPLIDAFRVDHPGIGPTTESSDGDGESCASASQPISAKSNVLLDLHMPSLIYDAEDIARPYKLFGYSDRGYCAAFSKDGIHFMPCGGNPVIPLLKFAAKNSRKTWFSDVAPVFKDMRAGNYVSHVKTYQSDAQGRIRRCVGYSASADFIHWSDPVTIWAPGSDEDKLARDRGFQWADFYGLCGFNYGDGYLGLLWLFFIDYEFEHGTHEGKIEVFLAASPDGRSWSRFSNTPLIPLSQNGWDTGMITTAGPVFLKDSIRLYYGGSNFDHVTGEKGKAYDEMNHRFSIGLATLRKDGFVCAISSCGRLTTEPIESERGVIKVNADCTGGKILIDLIAGQKRHSFTMAGIDAIDHKLHSKIKGNVALEVAIIGGAKLYSIEVL